MTKTTPVPKKGIEQIELYTPGVAPKAGTEMRKLSSNENLYGSSPRAIAAIQNAATSLWRYPNVDHLELRQAIAQTHDLDSGRIICGVGSDEILYLLAQAYAGEGDEVIMTQYGFEVYKIATHAVGADLVMASETERRVDVDAILNALTKRTKMVYIANPANPTSTILPQDELTRLAAALPPDVLLVVDSAYAEFADGYDGGADLATRLPNVFMTRTLSKLYGLGGLRVGWGYGPQEVVDTLNRIRGPFNLSNLALVGAKAAIEDQEYAQNCLECILRDRAFLRDAVSALGLKVDESATNFLLIRFESSDQAQNAREYLAQNGYLVRAVSHYGLPEALRITIGTRADNEAVAELLKKFMGVKQ